MRPRSPSRWLHRACGVVGLLGALVAGCVVSPQPEPPSIVASLLSIESSGESVTLRGAPGAVTPGGSTLEMLDLDTTAAGTSLPVALDGSFSLALGGALTDEYRLQASSSDLRSDPLDVTGIKGITVGTEALAVVTRPLASCFVLSPALEIAFQSASQTGSSSLFTRPVTLKNDCATDVTVGGFSLRTGAPAFTVAPVTGPLVVPVGGEASFTVTFNPTASGPTEDVLFVEITAPTASRRPLTLRGRVP